MSNIAKATSKELLHLVRQIVPPLLPSFHKGQAGRIVVIGGCEDYTGAPYFSASAALLFGCDLSHVICETRAASVIKSYGADLMVHPYLYDTLSIKKGSKMSDSAADDDYVSNKMKSISLEKSMSLLSRGIHCVVIGPGLGRDDVMTQTVIELIEFLKTKGIPMILDADALFIISKHPELIKGYKDCVLTPNVMEFKRLASALNIDLSDQTSSSIDILKKETSQVSKALGGIAILRKGPIDIIALGDIAITNSIQGSNRRVGGQGDTLTGILATLTSWSHAYRDNLWKHDESSVLKSDDELRLIACFGASCVARNASRLAFELNGRSMLTSDVQWALGKAYQVVIEGKE